ncbi:molybdopterin molybdotransferase MoeA [Robertkochia marina]|uniref:Molybdopterin molybdenumtransferase n=1 Tax=Robertkochia marina TaxID=1227945 RepID=A0A4S3M1A2_9FLAO|nr:molybdopterin molybdotransferase MoeA [Robertkochia marina]THD68862.1 molybdopterin molybdotransferase MoeA [Robertkochia marina]TRZ41108.1 molybdopterin molybdenumtransferase MoeA [Robertkochia marina]
MEKTFITYQEALKILEENKTSFPVAEVSIHDAGGLFLAEDLVADRDFPPYHRVTMDGIAIRHRTFENGTVSFPIQDVAPAGAPQKTLQDANACIEVMTGAILPKDADTVIRYEDLEISNGSATINVDAVTKRQNIHFKGIDITEETVIKNAGERISSAEINVAAAVGKDTIKVRRMPKTVIVSSGDELVDVHEKPLAHQIRRSNVYGIKNTLKEWGIPADLKHLPDEKEEMEKIISGLLEAYDMLVITGGVSKGKFDFLPEVLTKLGVEKQFHKIQQRPGKPFWFGKKDESTHIFALPGNPVSAFVCLYVYIRFWLQKSLEVVDGPVYAKLTEDVIFKPELIFFTEAKISYDQEATLWATPVFGNGSGDFVNLVNTDGFLVLPQEKNLFKKGEVYPFIPYRMKL